MAKIDEIKKATKTNLFNTSNFSILAVSGVSAAGDLVATAGQTRVLLSWTNPTNVYNLSAIQINYDSTAVPADQTAGTLLYSGTNTSVEQTGLSADVPYYYAMFTLDKTGEWSVLTANTSATATPFANNIYSSGLHPYMTNNQIRSMFIDEGII